MFNIVTNEHWMLVQRIPINYSEENRGKESKKMNEIQLLSHLWYVQPELKYDDAKCELP
jgi:hypothetical protein